MEGFNCSAVWQQRAEKMSQLSEIVRKIGLIHQLSMIIQNYCNYPYILSQLGKIKNACGRPVFVHVATRNLIKKECELRHGEHKVARYIEFLTNIMHFVH